MEGKRTGKNCEKNGCYRREESEEKLIITRPTDFSSISPSVYFS